MKNEKCGVGNATKKKAFDKVNMEGGEVVELIHGEHPHSMPDNNTYARTKQGNIYKFDGHRLPFKIEIEEYNYLKSSELSGDEIRKGCSVKVFCNGVQVFDEFSRNYEHGYRIAHQFIIDMEQNWGWFPLEINKEIGRTIGYKEQLFKIKRFVVSQACMILETLNGKPMKKFLWEDEEDYEAEKTLKVEITSQHISWYPKS